MTELIIIFILWVIASAVSASSPGAGANSPVVLFIIFVPILVLSLRRYLLEKKESEHWRELQARMKGLELNQQQVLRRLHELEHPSAIAAKEAKPAAEAAVSRFMPETEKKPAAEHKPFAPPATPAPPVEVHPRPETPQVPAAMPEPPAPRPAPPAVPSVPVTPPLAAQKETAVPPAAPPTSIPPAPPAAKPVTPPVPHVPPSVQVPPTAARVASNIAQPAAMRGSGGGSMSFAGYAAAPPRPPKPKRNLEETIGTNWLAKISVAMLVLGIALFLSWQWHNMSALGRIGLGMLAGAGVLTFGIFLEKRERYVILGRVCIGGGWAIIFVTTYAMRFFKGAEVLPSDIAGFVLLFLVAVAMVAHTLRYRTQLVTGAAFILAYSTVWVGHTDQIYSLTANALLSAGLIVLVVRYNWFELEVLGILAAYINHFYWLMPIIERAGPHKPFDQFLPSAFMLIFYWAVFRGSYLVRKVKTDHEEKVSTLAALLNSFGLLALMKYQSVHPEWAFRFLLILGAVELLLGQLSIVLGQLSIARKRRMAFVMLSTIGATLLVIAFPFHYAPESAQLSVWWLGLAEAFFLAGIFAREALFRYFGMFAGLVAAVQILARQGFTADSDLHRASIFGLAAVLFYLNSLITPRYSKKLVTSSFELSCLRAFSYIAAVMAFSAVWAGFSNTWVAVLWAALALVLILGGAYLRSWDLCYQSYGFVAAAFVGVLAYDINLSYTPASHFNLRVLRFVLVALAFYLCAWRNHTLDRLWASAARGIHTSLASVLIAVLIWFEYPNCWMAVSWMIFALALGAVARYGDLSEFSWQSYAITVAAFLRTLLFNFDDFQLPHGQALNVRLLTVVLVAAMLYGCAALRWKSKTQTSVIARWMQNFAASILLVLLGWVEYQNDWVAAIWILFALAAALVWRYLKLREFAIKSGLLAVVAVVRVAIVNLQDNSGTWHGMGLRLLTVAIVIAALYIMAPLSRLKEFSITSHLANLYTWMASALVMTLVWYQMHDQRAVMVAIAWTFFALVLFEIGMYQPSLHLRLQSYVALGASFARIWFANLNAVQLPGTISPRIYTVLPLALVLYWVWWRLDETDKAGRQSGTERGLGVLQLTGFLGLITLGAIMRVAMDQEQVVIGWSVLALALMATAWMTKRLIFHYQALFAVAGIAIRGGFYNLLSERPMQLDATHRPWFCVGITVALLFLTLPFAFKMREWKSERGNRLLLWIEENPHQLFFFVPLVLLTVLLCK